jgi:predicted DCC family thiol-disulfide oxidoreductase YuxK
MKPELGTLYYDGSCRFCTDGVMRLRAWLAKRGVEIKPFELEAGAPFPEEMRLRCRDGREFGGADAALVVVGARWWGKPLEWIGKLPGIHALLEAGYRWVAQRRHCIGGACQISLPEESDRELGDEVRPIRKTRPLTLWSGWLVMIGLTLLAGWAGFALELENWIRMWLLAVAMWLGFKTLALATTAADGWPRGAMGWLGFALWPGMDVAAFTGRSRPRVYRESEAKVAAVAVLRVLAGGALIFWLAERLVNPVAVGWCGMIALVLALHFGLFDLLALGWRRVGYDVERLMNAPWRARSLADFWGGRWNRAFSRVTNRALFRPMTRRFGVAWGTLAGFFLSGVIHEVVISVPAGGGYGLPTLYFLAQGLGVLLERRLGWRGDWRGRVLMVVVVLGPAFWLFHVEYMKEVMVPMLELMAN